jgi:hypothetical protein
MIKLELILFHKPDGRTLWRFEPPAAIGAVANQDGFAHLCRWLSAVARKRLGDAAADGLGELSVVHSFVHHRCRWQPGSLDAAL